MRTNAASVHGARLVFVDAAESAWSVQGVDAPATARLSGVAPTSEAFSVGVGGMGRGGDVTVVMDVAAGAEARFGYVQRCRHEQGRGLRRVRRGRRRRRRGGRGIRAVLERAARSGLSLQETASSRVTFRCSRRRRRRSAASTGGESSASSTCVATIAGNVLGRSYDTLMPNYWGTTTFIWDYSLSSVMHALLDPAEMRRQLRHWVVSDTHTLYGTSSLTGGPIGQWYSVNDYAMTRLVRDYVRFTGDVGFLDERADDGRTRARPPPVLGAGLAGAAPIDRRSRTTARSRTCSSASARTRTRSRASMPRTCGTCG